MIRTPKQTLHDETDPAGDTIRSLANWPDSDLFRLARGLAGELNSRHAATPAALPVALLTHATIDRTEVFLSHHS
jgi:hypothetical protein